MGSIILTEAQKQIVLDHHRFRVVNCGRKFGKTTLASVEMVGKALSKNDCRVLYMAPTIGEARDLMWNDVNRLCKPILVKAVQSPSMELWVRSQYGENSIIYLKGWEAVENVRGMQFDFIVLDEVAKFKNFWMLWQEVLRPTLTPRKGEALFLSTPRGYNHFFDLCNLQDEDRDYKSFHFTSYDNLYIPKEEIDKAKQELTEDRFAQEYLADFRKVHGLVYKEFDRQRHLFSLVAPPRKERILGVDFGYTNPSAVLVIDKDFDNNYWIVEEYYKTGKTNIEVIEYCKSKLPNVVYPDPAEPDRIEEMRRHALNVREVSKDIEAGINKIRELFKANRIKIHKNCINLISELETYSYPDKKPEKNEPEIPIPENNHACDACRYSLFMNDQQQTDFKTVKQHRPTLKGY